MLFSIFWTEYIHTFFTVSLIAQVSIGQAELVTHSVSLSRIILVHIIILADT